MFPRSKRRFKNGEWHRYYSVVENRRVSGDRVVQQQVLYRGNTNDQKTLADRVKELKEAYGLKDVIMAGNRGMITAARLPELNEVGIRSITTLTHAEILKLVGHKVIEPELFDEQEIAHVCDPEAPDVRYLLCRNPLTGESGLARCSCNC